MKTWRSQIKRAVYRSENGTFCSFVLVSALRAGKGAERQLWKGHEDVLVSKATRYIVYRVSKKKVPYCKLRLMRVFLAFPCTFVHFYRILRHAWYLDIHWYHIQEYQRAWKGPKRSPMSQFAIRHFF